MNNVKLNLLDKISLQKKLMSDHVVSYSANDRYSIIVEDGVYIYSLDGRMDNPIQSFSFEKEFIAVPQLNLVSDQELKDDGMLTILSRNTLYETILFNNAIPNAADTNKQQFVSVKWSSQDLIENCQCAIACLSHTGILTVFVHALNEVEYGSYYMISNISNRCVDYFLPVQEYDTLDDKYEQFKKHFNETLPLCFIWSDLFTKQNEKYCLLIVGHSNGSITFWKFNTRKSNDISENGISFLFCYKTQMSNVTALHLQLAESGGILFMSNSEGLIKTVVVKFEDSHKLNLNHELYLWDKRDDLKVHNFYSLIIENMFCILIHKGNVLLTFMFNNNGTLIDKHGYNFRDLRITQIQKFEENAVLVLSSSGDMIIIKISCCNNQLVVESKTVTCNLNWSDYEARGIILSKNNTFYAVLVNEKSFKNLKNSFGCSKMLIFHDILNDPLEVLKKSNNDSLRNYWDCFEILRLSSMINKTLPTADLPAKLNYDKLTIFKLKICMLLVKISDMIHDKLPTVVEKQILTYDELKYIVKIKLAAQHMNHLLVVFIEQKSLPEFHLQSLYILNMFLKNVIIEGIFLKLELGENTIDEIYNVIKSSRQLDYPVPPKCVFCKKDIVGLTCNPLHIDSRCNISLMQVIDLPYYKCSICRGIVHERMKEVYDVVLCPNCDIPLQLISKIIGGTQCISTTNREEK